MKIEIKIPTVGESITEGTVSAILKPNGTVVKADDEILEIETDKVNQIVYAPEAGAVHITVQVHDKVTVGQVVGFIDTEAKAHTSVSSVDTTHQKQVAPSSEFSARKMPEQYVAEISQPPHKLPEKPLLKPPASLPKTAPVSSAQVTRTRMSNLRKVISKKLVEAKNTTAMLTTFNEIDLSAVIAIRDREKETFLSRHGVKLGFMSFFVKGVVAALKAIPQVNAALDGEEILTYHTYDIGIAVSTEKGLMVPIVRGCDALSYAEIEQAIAHFAKKARSGTMAVDDLRGGSFTISNAGSFGSLLSTPILNPPQSAILGMHNILKRPVVVDDQIVIRPMMYVALSYDHRIIDGKEAVLFLVALKESLEDPSRMLLGL